MLIYTIHTLSARQSLPGAEVHAVRAEDIVEA